LNVVTDICNQGRAVAAKSYETGACNFSGR
jgi:hypothetical protein